MDSFNHADFYDCTGADEFYASSPNEAIEELFDFNWTPGSNPEALLDKLCPITVKAFSRDVVSDSLVQREIDRFLEHLEEAIDEDYGKPCEFRALWSKSDRDVIRRKVTEAVKFAASAAEVWRCTEVATRVYSRDEVAELLKSWIG